MSESITKLCSLIAYLRGSDGCIWDQEQTADSLIPSLIEETYEVVESIQKRNFSDLEEELGDILINILMQAQIASEKNQFTFESVVSCAQKKLIRRHPHIFEKPEKLDKVSLSNQWEKIKQEEKNSKNLSDSTLFSSILSSFPALLRAQKIQDKAKKVGLKFLLIHEIVLKLEAEMNSLISSQLDPAEIETKIGELLFLIVLLASNFACNAESTLQKFNQNFISQTERAIAKEQRLTND